MGRRYGEPAGENEPLAPKWPLKATRSRDRLARPMSTPIAAEMYTVRDAADADLVGTLERIAAIGYLGVELVGLHGMAPEEFLSHVDRLELEVIGGSLPFLDEAEVPQYLDELRAIECEQIITHLDDKHFASPEAIRSAAELCNDFAAGLSEEGRHLLYHNHWWEFAPGADGRPAFLDFAEQLGPDVSLLVDVYWVATGGADVAATLTELAPRVQRIHLKDGPINETDPQTAVGAGKVDIPAAIAAAPQSDWHVTELDEFAGDPLDALEQSYRYLTEGGFSRGRANN